jgi:hypothetical protein
MKRLLLFIILLMFSLPLRGIAQRLSVYNLGVHAGVEYSRLYWNYHNESNPFTGTRDDFNIRPHAQLTYELSLSDHFKPRIFTGYSRMGYREEFTYDGNLSEKRRQHLRMNTISIGVKGLFDTSLFKIGPIFSWYKILDGKYEYQIKRPTGEWNTLHVDDNHDRYVADHSFEIGFSIHRFMGPNFVFSFEGLYTIRNIFIHEDRLATPVMQEYTWYPQHYRLTIGYAL